MHVVYRMNFYHSIEGVTLNSFPVVDIVSSVMLAASGDLELHRIINIVLQALHKSNSVLASKQRILARRLLSSPPPWVAENVDVWTPEGESCVTHVVHRPRFSRHRL